MHISIKKNEVLKVGGFYKMRAVELNLNSMEKVRTFFNRITNMKGDYDIEQGRKYIDARSLLGIFTLDLKKPIILQVHDDEQYLSVLNKLKDLAA